jgi:LytS/YehU family sensor histidine kinase
MLVRRNDNAQAVRMLAGLSDLLRYVLQDSPGDEVPLREEISFLERYLDIERVRFGDRLSVEVEVDAPARDALVPTLILQPLVENALIHGEPGTDGIRRVWLKATRPDGRLRLEVANTGSLSGGPTAGSRGLALTRDRLRQVYTTGARLELEDGGGWVVTRLEIDSPAVTENERTSS